jgi:hypothetical protein
MSAEIDLYKDDLAAFSDQELYVAVEAFTGVARPAADRTQEGYLLDFKEAWSERALRTVAAFANTFGGILLVGVSEQQGRADQLVGIATQRKELKTSIASSIATNIVPTPPYEIREVIFPQTPERHLCIVRVRKGNSLHLLTKKEEWPVYVRNEDESRSANAAQLQTLLSMRVASSHATPEELSQHTQGFLGAQNMYVMHARDGAADAQRVRSETFLHVYLKPAEPLAVRLDLSLERQFFGFVRSCFPAVAENVDQHGRNIGASFEEYRWRDWYNVTYVETFRDYEMRWGLDSAGAVHFVTQVRCKLLDQEPASDVWSLCDVMTNLDCAVELAHQFWDYINYVGEGNVTAYLQVEALPLLVRSDGMQSAYASGFYEKSSPRRRARPLSTDALTGAQRPGARPLAAAELTYATRWGNHAEVVSILVNQFLRDLGYASNLADLRACLT